MGSRSARLTADATYDTAASYTENDARTGQEAQDQGDKASKHAKAAGTNSS